MKIILNSFAEVQDLLDKFVAANQLTPGPAPHGVFWRQWGDGSPTTYTDFTTGDVPGIGLPILVKGNAAKSNLITILSGPLGRLPQMPRPNPPYNANTPTQDDVVAALTDWINNNCPDTSSTAY